MNLEEQIKSICGAATPAGGPTPGPVSPTLKFLVCRKCGQIAEWHTDRDAPSKCPCGASGGALIMPTKEAAEAASKQFQGISSAPVSEKPIVPAATPVEVENPQPDPTPVPPTPRPTKKTRPVAPKPIDPAATSVQTPSVSQQNGALIVGSKETREAAERLLIARLNPISVVEVGTGVVDALGFTVWTDGPHGRVPTWNFKELTDTPESFKRELNEARRSDGNVTVDCARVTTLEPTDLSTARYQGLLVANLNSGSGRVSCMPGSKIRIGAKLTHAGRPVFFVVGLA